MTHTIDFDRDECATTTATIDSLTADQIERLQVALEEWGFGEIAYDFHLARTRNTVADHRDARDGYRKPGIVRIDRDDLLTIDRVQVVRGQQERYLAIIDVGDGLTVVADTNPQPAPIRAI